MASTPVIILSSPGGTSDTLARAVAKINANFTALDTALAAKAAVSSVPTALSALYNDAGYVTQAGARAALSASGALTYNAVTGVLSYTPATITSASIADASSVNAASTVVLRDSAGNFAAGTITGSLAGNATSATTASRLISQRTIAFSGDLSGSGNFDGSSNLTIAAALSNTAVVAGTYGAADVVPTLTVDAKGRITAASTSPIGFPVASVAGRTGAITLARADVGLSNVDNTSDTTKAATGNPIGDAIAARAALSGAAFTGAVRATSLAVTRASDRGGLLLTAGDTTHTGTIEFLPAGSGVRHGYLGFSTGTTIELAAEVGRFNFVGANDPQVRGNAILHTGSFNPNTKASLDTSVTFAAILGSGLEVSTAGDATLTLQDTSATADRYKIKQVTSSKNWDGGDSFLFKQIRPSDNRVLNYALGGPSGTIWHSGILPVAPTVQGITALSPHASIGFIPCSGYQTAGDGGACAYKRGTSSGVGARQDALGGWWVMDNPAGAPAEAFGARTTSNDGPIFQAILTTVGVLNLGAAVYVVRSPVITGAGEVNIVGVSMDKTVIVTDVAGDLFRHGLDAPPGYSSALRISNCRIARSGGTRNTTTNKIPGTALSVRGRNGTGMVELTNVRFDSYSAESAWEKFIHMTATGLVKLTNVHTHAGAFESTQSALAKGTDVGIHLYSGGNDQLNYQIRFQDCVLEGIYNAVFIEIDGPQGNTGSCEGVSFIDCGGRSVLGPWIKQRITKPATGGGLQPWYPPGFWMERSNFQGTYALLDIDSASEVHVTGNFHYVEGAPYAPHSYTPHFVRIGQTINCFIKDNSFYAFNGAKFGNPSPQPVRLQSLLAIEKGDHVVVTNNRLSVEAGADVGYGVLLPVQSGTQKVIASGNSFDGGGGLPLNPWPWGDARRLFNGPIYFYADGSDKAAAFLVTPSSNQTTGLFLLSSVNGSAAMRQVKLGPVDANNRCTLYVDA